MTPEETILRAICVLISVRTNEILIEIADNADDDVQCPALEAAKEESTIPSRPGNVDYTIVQAELTEKDRIVKTSRYCLTITLSAEGRRPATQCYRYASALGRALRENPTLDGIAAHTAITKKDYRPPRVRESGEMHRLLISVSVTVETV